MSDRLQYRVDKIISEFQFITSRSSGAGGQHVNKTESKVTLIFNLRESLHFSIEEKELMQINLGSRLRKGILRTTSQASRSQHRNKEIAIQRMLEILEKALFVAKPGKKKKLTKGQKEARLKSKRIKSNKKTLRKKVDRDDD
jgi:ribosome-associated protein